MTERKRYWAPACAGVTSLLLVSCTVGPDYRRPDVDLPKDFGVAQSAAALPAKWWALFNDPVLDRLVDEALAANRNLRVAAERVEEARAQLTIARAALWPDAGVEAKASRDRISALTAGFGLPQPTVKADSKIRKQIHEEARNPRPGFRGRPFILSEAQTAIGSSLSRLNRDRAPRVARGPSPSGPRRLRRRCRCLSHRSWSSGSRRCRI